MQKRSRDTGHNDERQIKKWNRFKLFFAKKEGGLRFDLLHRFHYWWLGGRSIVRSIFRVAAAQQGAAIVGSLLLGGYVLAAFYTQSGEFIIRVDHPGEKKLILDDTADFSDPRVVLKGKAITEADNISIFEIDPRVAEIDGEHNGEDYVAYTFYVKNISRGPVTYSYNLMIEHATKGIEKASWVLLWKNGQQQIFAMPREDGTPEWQKSQFAFPFMEEAADAEMMLPEDDWWRLETTPFASSKTVDMGLREDMMPDEIDQYTVVIWLEGEDPECVNDILGGTIELAMKFKY